ncbi:MAG TPA: endolytic transglycosylase MltG [Candidatus Limnocylindrales bacterium]
MSDPHRQRSQARPVGPQRGTVRAKGSVRRAPGGGAGNGRRSIRLGAVAVVAVLAVVILVGGAVVLRPALSGWAVGFAASNPQSLRTGFIADLVAEALGDELTAPVSDDTDPVPFEVTSGATASEVASALARAGLISRPLVFEYVAITGGKAADIQAGTYELTPSMTPQAILAALQDAPVRTVTVGLREGLRLEQAAAYLQTLGIRPEAAQEYLELAREPTDELREAYPVLATLPEGRSLEGYLAGGTFEVFPFVTGPELVRLQLDEFGRQLEASGALKKAERGDRDFYQLLTLASIVEREAGVDAERPRIAGVYANRLDPERWATGLLESDPTVFYGWDSVQLDDQPFDAWPDFTFWTPPGKPLKEVDLPDGLASYQSYREPGLPDGPIATPTMASIEAALEPDTSKGFLFFVLKNDDSRTHAFARTYEEHQANLRKYGYQ